MSTTGIIILVVVFVPGVGEAAVTGGVDEGNASLLAFKFDHFFISTCPREMPLASRSPDGIEGVASSK